jgi:hypothetical protein
VIALAIRSVSNQLAILKSIEISKKKSEFFPLTDFVPYRGHHDNKKSTAEPYHFFYIFLLNFQKKTSVEQKNYKNLFLDFFLTHFGYFKNGTFIHFQKWQTHMQNISHTRSNFQKNKC